MRVLEAARNELLFAHRYLERALFRLHPVPDSRIPFGADGRELFFSPEILLQAYAAAPSAVTRACLHSVLHCLYLHPRYAAGKDTRLWNLAADLAVADIAASLGAPLSEEAEEDGKKREILETLSGSVRMMSAQNLYAYLRGGGCAAGYSLRELAEMFAVDSHALWNTDKPERNSESAPDSGLWREWKDAAEAFTVALSDAEARRKLLGKNPGRILKTLENLTRENYDYRWFLRRFAHPEEQMRLDPNEFDVVFYTYGLELYGNLPLIEPLEYREAWVVRNFVIAIDTSASCDGILVRKFLEKTVSILSETSGLSQKVNIHLLQCDAAIQGDLRINDPAQLESLVSRFTLRGFGGTDFCPVFAYVDELCSKEKLPAPDGLVYFTDGLGKFPPKAPRYRTAFVFVNRDENVRVPPWAMRVYLDAETLS